MMNYHFEDFTETEYRNILKTAKANWEFIDFTACKKAGRVCLWRHDVDFSIHRAYRLAQIEAEENVKTTYFIHLHSEFYNFLERGIADLIGEIQNLGHHLGLHFDPAFYVTRLPKDKGMTDWLKFEQRILAQAFETEIRVVSFHNPDVGDWLSIEQDEIVGMINVYGQHFRENYTYIADSNGYWRFQRLADVLEAAEDEKLHILTHPEWWTPEPMSPRARVSRCIDGRAAGQHKRYDELLKKAGRENIR